MAAHCEAFCAVLLARAYHTDRFLSAGRTVRPVRVQTQTALGRFGKLASIASHQLK